jgi:hypothetical protein
MKVKTRTPKLLSAAIMVGLMGLGLTACGESSATTAPSPVMANNAFGFGNGVGNGVGAGPTNRAATVAPASPAVLTALGRAIQDEYHAQYTYLGVLADLGPIAPFSNIVRAEERHAEAAAGLFVNRNLDVPESEWNLGNVPRFGSVQEACAAAARAEEDNIAMYDEFLELDLPQDVRNVFTNNRRASLENHLPAFERCR